MKRAITILLCFLLMFGSGFLLFDDGENAEGKVIVHNETTYVSHEPIRINSNANFTAANGVTGGNGTIWNPWVIEGWEINGTNSANCIYIGNTTDEFIVRNCYLFDVIKIDGIPYDDFAGLYLHDVDGGLITKNIIQNNYDLGIRVSDNSTHLNIDNNTISKSKIGIQYYGSYNTKIYNNTIFDCDFGIFCTDNANVFDNELINNKNHLYFTRMEPNSKAYNNTIKGGGLAIKFQDTDSFSVTDNLILNVVNGFILYRSSGITLSGNTVSCERVAVELINSNYTLIYGNDFIDTSGYEWPLAIDDGNGPNNEWDLGQYHGGNYWSTYEGYDNDSDGYGDTPFPINHNLTEIGFNKDLFPLMLPSIDLEAPSSIINQYDLERRILDQNSILINATASDVGGSGINNVQLYYKYSPNPYINGTHDINHPSYSNWTIYEIDYSFPYQWEFTFPEGEGSYIFTSNSTDNANNSESFNSQNVQLLYRLSPIININFYNNEIMQPGKVLEFSIIEENLANATIELHKHLGAELVFIENIASNYSFDTKELDDGTYFFVLSIKERLEKTISTFKEYMFTIDGTPPIVGISPDNNFVKLDSEIQLYFWESMNTSSVESAFSISPSIGSYEFIWQDDNSTCIVNRTSLFLKNTTYSITINNSAKDLVGNHLKYTWIQNFTTNDFDGDGITDWYDLDDDNDGVPDTDDTFPFDKSESSDNDEDGIGDNADPDDDNDGIPDTEDAFPFDPSETSDFDNDGIGDNADPDDDNDGIPDIEDYEPFNPDISEAPPPIAEVDEDNFNLHLIAFLMTVLILWTIISIMKD